MSWVTVVWSMIASACLTLAVIYFVVWLRNRAVWAHLLFAITAASTTAFVFCELLLMRSATPEGLLAMLSLSHVPLAVLLISLTCFVRVYLGTGRPWLMWIAVLSRGAFALATVIFGQLNLRAVTAIREVQFLGEPVATLAGGVPNPLMLVGLTTTLLILVFVADASITAWRRGDRRRAVMVGASVEFFLLVGLGSSTAIIWKDLELPLTFGMFYMGLVIVMGYELSRDVLRASQLVQELQVTEARLREHQVKLEASHQQISVLFGRLIAAQETERTRIARDLHDDVSQRIAALSIAMSSLKRKLLGGAADESSVVAMSAIQRDTTALAEEVRHVSHDLHPSLLQHTGLVPALNGLCAQFGTQRAIAVTWSAVPDLGPIDADTALCLYRVTQEALHNVGKHAQARRIDVRLTRTASGVQLSIADDGKGFDLTDTRERASGLGLVSIDERVRMLRGAVDIETKPGRGTLVLVRIPTADGMGPVDAAALPA